MALTLGCFNMSFIDPAVNYFDNGDAQKGTYRFSLFNTTFSGGVPTTISAGAAALTLTTQTTNALVNTASLQLQKTSAVNSIGQGMISDPMLLNRGDLAKVLNWAFDFERTAGTIDASGGASSTFQIWIFDVASSTWTQPSGFRGITQSQGPGICTGSFQTSATATTIRLAIIVSETLTTTWTMLFDNFQMSRSRVASGPIITDWQSYTPNIINATLGSSVVEGRWRRVGDSMQVRGSLYWGTGGSLTASELRASLPTGFSIDSTKTANFSERSVGYASLHNGGAYRFDVGVNAFTVTDFAFISKTGGGPNGNFVSSVTPDASWFNASGDALTWFAEFPIVGWSSNTILSQDADNRITQAVLASAANVSIPNNADTQITNLNILQDTAGAATASQYTVPTTGVYLVTARAIFAALGSAVTSALRIRLYTGGSFFADIAAADFISTQQQGSASIIQGTVAFTFNAGTVLTFRVFHNSGAARNVLLDSVFITRNPGPAQVAASEVVTGYARNSSG